MTNISGKRQQLGDSPMVQINTDWGVLLSYGVLWLSPEHLDFAGADIVLGMLPLAREFLRVGVEVVLCANSLPAINDVTAPELRELLDQVAGLCPIIQVPFPMNNHFTIGSRHDRCRLGEEVKTRYVRSDLASI